MQHNMSTSSAEAAANVTMEPSAAQDEQLDDATLHTTPLPNTNHKIDAYRAKLDAMRAAGEHISKRALKYLVKLQQRELSRADRQQRKRDSKTNFRQALAKRTKLAAAGSTAAAPSEPDAAFCLERHSAAAWAFWSSIGSPTRVLAPMVNQSCLAFRLLARRHGAQLTYTPMIHSRNFARDRQYRMENWDGHPQDRPMVTQFCGDDPDVLLEAARLVESECDAIELNCGCPQGIAKRGHYGAFLLDEPYLIARIVRHLAAKLSIPVMVKFRVVPLGSRGASELESAPLPSPPPAPEHRPTVALALALQEAGCSVLTLHGRTRDQKCAVDADWEAIAAVKSAVSIPVVANGGIERPEDVNVCLRRTGADAVMSSEAALENPGILGGVPLSRARQVLYAREYMSLAREHPPRTPHIVRSHMMKLLYMAINERTDLRDLLVAARGEQMSRV